MPEILSLREHPEWTEPAASWFHRQWSVPETAYRESIARCQAEPGGVVQWYLIPGGAGRIAAGLGCIENDFHPRQDLSPNLCALYVAPDWRGRGLARALLEHACRDLAARGVSDLYLLTDHTAFYERCGWSYLCPVTDNAGDSLRVYHRQLTGGGNP